ncbi:ORF6N domain-containing protein [Spiribacter onubensis]|uniref:KilA-N DNA-binding domain-containing protein n=1 Tax=Spiribacter onubensis TaxID=3122420 RepID=A0ABV3SAS2_9GAMM
MTDQFSEAPFEYRGEPVLGLRQIDRMNGAAKGTAFRAFKRVRHALQEDREFFVVDIDAPGDAKSARLMGDMKEAGALYPASRVAVLITAEAYARMQGVARLPAR